MNALVVIGLVAFGAGVVCGALPEKAHKYFAFGGLALAALGVFLHYGLDVKVPRIVRGQGR